MKHSLFPLIITAFFSLTNPPIYASEEPVVIEEKKVVIQLKTDDFELHETDISHLEVGDAETIYTESGKRIDLLKSKDGVEIYIDGELLDIPAHEEHKIVHKHVEVICDDEAECDEHVWISEDSDLDAKAMHPEHEERVIVIKKKVKITES
jgi:hypothetical protein